VKTIEISLRIAVPDNADVGVPTIAMSVPAGTDPVEAFWLGLGVTARKVFRTAALIETSKGPGYTFDDIAASMSVDHQTVLAYNRNCARTAKAWEERTATKAPIKFTLDDYRPIEGDSGPERSILRLGALAERILELPDPG
jgi:hypothetical protein